MRGSFVKLVPKSSRFTTESTSPWATRAASSCRRSRATLATVAGRSDGGIARSDSGSASSSRSTSGAGPRAHAIGRTAGGPARPPGLRSLRRLATALETSGRRRGRADGACGIKRGAGAGPLNYTDVAAQNSNLTPSCTRRLPALLPVISVKLLTSAVFVLREHVGVVEQVVRLEPQLHGPRAEADPLAEAEVDVPVARAREPRRARSCPPGYGPKSLFPVIGLTYPPACATSGVRSSSDELVRVVSRRRRRSPSVDPVGILARACRATKPFVQSHSVNGYPVRAVKIQLSCQSDASALVKPVAPRANGSSTRRTVQRDAGRRTARSPSRASGRRHPDTRGCSCCCRRR